MKKDSELISVLVPVYNAEKYLRQCLDSILNQTYKNIEIVCVNDASSDNSLTVLNEYAQKDERIIVIDKKINEGTSFARKTALENSNGKYIIPIDNDDWIEKNMLEKMHNEMYAQNCDMVCCGIFMEFEKEGRTAIEKAPNFPQNKIERIRLGCFGQFVMVMVLWNKLISREIYEKVVFSKENNGEDDFVTCQTLYYCENIKSIPDELYHWRVREDSLSHERKDKEKLTRNYLNRKANYTRVIEFLKNKFGDDLSAFEPNLSLKRVTFETLNPNKSDVIQEFEDLQDFIRKSSKEAIKESANRIVERIKINLEKIQNTEEIYCLPAFIFLLEKVKSSIFAQKESTI